MQKCYTKINIAHDVEIELHYSRQQAPTATKDPNEKELKNPGLQISESIFDTIAAPFAVEMVIVEEVCSAVEVAELASLLEDEVVDVTKLDDNV